MSFFTVTASPHVIGASARTNAAPSTSPTVTAGVYGSLMPLTLPAGS